MTVAFDTLLKEIRQGHFPDSHDLLPYLTNESKKQRSYINTEIAIACLNTGSERHLNLAKDLIQRAWLLSDFDETLLPIFVAIHAPLKDVDAIRDAYKRVGIKFAEQNRIVDAMKMFSLSMYTYSNYGIGDKYSYDFEMLYHIEQMACKYRLPAINKAPYEGRKLKIAYLVFGAYQVGSVIVKIIKGLADHHDSSKYDVALIVPEPVEVEERPAASIHILRLSKWPVIQPKKAGKDRLLETALNIHSFAPDILVTSAVLADLNHYFIASLFDSLKVVGLLFGPPPQFVAPKFQHAICPSFHPLIDSPCDTYHVKLEGELPSLDEVVTSSRNDLNIPNNAFLLASGGRKIKFDHPDFWNGIKSILQSSPDVYFLAMGIEGLPNDVKKRFPSELLDRIRFVGWQKDYLNILCMANLCLDTFPSGGGVFLMEAMALEIPVIGFKNDYRGHYDQTNWSPLQEFCPIDDLTVERGNWHALLQLFITLHCNCDLREKVAIVCKDFMNSNYGNLKRMTSEYERIFEKILFSSVNHSLS